MTQHTVCLDCREYVRPGDEAILIDFDQAGDAMWRHKDCPIDVDPDAPYRCGVHHWTEDANIAGGYDCCCGAAWLSRLNHCASGSREGDPVA
jgi:hypothetical protein